jgi:hypothetical protein
VTPTDAAKSVEEKLMAASGKSVLVQRDPNCSGHIAIAPREVQRFAPLLDHVRSVQFAPHEDVGIDFSKEYEAAKEMRG